MRKAMGEAATATRYLAVTGALAVGVDFLGVMLVVAVLGSLAGFGLWLLPETVLMVRRVAGAKRVQTAARTGRRIPEAYRPVPAGLRERLRGVLGDPGTRRDLRWMAAHSGYGLLLSALAVPLWPLAAVVDGVWSGVLRRKAVVLPLIGRLADLDARWSQALLRPSPEALLAARVEELAETRAAATAAHGAELRRIERDLHDGVQAQLVTLSMRIGLAKRACDHDPAAVRALLDDAHDHVEEALAALRHVVRGIHPPVLTDRGLVGAVQALAAGSGLDVTVRVDGAVESGGRAPAAVEAAAYFAVAEALTNVAKHSGSERATVRLERLRTGLRAVVEDEGSGGADEAGGTGLLGIRRRVAALDGTVVVTSPPGGPTVVVVDLPCVW
ncbi:histidine kinase [Streptomyces sp. NPDC096105]|uniref:sensor histidine kinase n=1 Tax=Streptomyces sp. NPDC096105 TaxID=3366074 RepID=UPI0037FEC2A1